MSEPATGPSSEWPPLSPPIHPMVWPPVPPPAQPPSQPPVSASHAPGQRIPGDLVAAHTEAVGSTPVPQSPVQSRRSRAGKVVGGGAVAAGGVAQLFGKVFLLGKGLLVLAKFKTAFTMLISVGAYAIFWGWRFALGFVLLIFVHEMGHVVVLRAQGIKASAPMFIPFLGAFVKLEQPQRSVTEEAVSAIAGPVLGVIGAGAVLFAADLTGSPLLRALAYTAFLINLFNLVPVLPLDGGRVAGALHPGIWFAGMAVAIGFLIFHPSIVLVFVLVLGGVETVRRWSARRAGKDNAYYTVRPAVRWQIAAAYVTVAAVCLYGMHVSYLPPPG